MTMREIETRAQAYASARDELGGMVAALEEGIEALKREHLPAIRRAIRKASEHHERLRQAIDMAPGEFERPRTQILHGIRVGYAKGKGRLVIEDENRAMTRIRLHYPEQVEYLIACKYTPVKEALLKLPAADLKKIGARIEGTEDEIVIRPVDGAVEKMVDALLKSATEGEPA